MSSKDQEIEVKFLIADLPALEQRLKRLGAELKQERVHEINLRFDTPTGELARSYRVLRLRKDTAARVTFKGPGSVVGGAKQRQELEFTVDNYETALAFFQALGYQVVVMYEKYRAIYALGDVLVTLDEMPYGTFAEIEGPDGASIQQAGNLLGLDWHKRVLDSYLMLFDQLKASLSLDFRDLSFENFEGISVSPEQLGGSPADL